MVAIKRVESEGKGLPFTALREIKVRRWAGCLSLPLFDLSPPLGAGCPALRPCCSAPLTLMFHQKVLRDAHHAHVIELLDVFAKTDRLFLVFELCITDLSKIVSDRRFPLTTGYIKVAWLIQREEQGGERQRCTCRVPL